MRSCFFRPAVLSLCRAARSIDPVMVSHRGNQRPVDVCAGGAADWSGIKRSPSERQESFPSSIRRIPPRPPRTGGPPAFGDVEALAPSRLMPTQHVIETPNPAIPADNLDALEESRRSECIVADTSTRLVKKQNKES